MTGTKLVKSATVIMMMTFINKAVGFLRDSLVASAFGTTYVTDAYNMAMTIVDFLFIMIALAITTTFIPVLSDILNKKGKEEMFSFANNLINILVTISIIVVILSIYFAPLLVRLIAPKFKGETLVLAIQLTKISAVSLVFLVIHSAYTAVLQTMDDFVIPTIVGILLNLPIIIYILLGAKGGVVGLTVATVLGMVLRAIAQIPFLIKHGFKFRPTICFSDNRIKSMIILIIPVIIGAGANQINKVVDKTISSGLPEGSIAALSFGGRLSDVVYSTFAIAIITVIFPTLSKTISENNSDEFKSYIIKTVNSINLIMIPSTVAMIVLSTPLVTLLFKRGAFDDRSVTMTSQVIIFYSMGLTFYSLRDVFNKALFAMKDTRTSTINSIISVAINILLNIFSVKYLGLRGIAMSSAVSALICAILLYRSLYKKVCGVDGRAILVSGIKIIAASSVMGLAIILSYKLTITHFNSFAGMAFSILVSILIGATIYFILISLLKIEEFAFLLYGLKNKIFRKNG